MNKNTIAILDDEPDRIEAMLAVLSKRRPEQQVVAFDNAPDMIAWLQDHVQSCILICLDHDLGACTVREGIEFDPGTGRDVADCLAAEKTVCPIIIHTTNNEARPGMILAMEDAGWNVSYVSPYANLLWVREVWSEAVEAALS
jgi:CheY-like chemotaxis protein